MRVIRSDGKLKLFGLEYAEADRARRVGGGIWNKNERCWVYPLQAAPFLLEQFPRVVVDSSASEVFKHFEKVQSRVSALINKEVAPRQHDFLMEHQRRSRDIAQFMHRYAFYMDTGTGKTLTAFAIIADNPGVRWVVVCPKSIVKAAWMEDHDKFFPNIRLLPMSKNIKTEEYRSIAEAWGVAFHPRMNREALQGLLLVHAQVVVINPESFKTDPLVDAWEHDGLIVDESSIMRNMKTGTTKHILDKAAKLSKVYLLSGKPAPNTELEYFPQMLAVNPALFGGSYYSFRERYFETTDYLGYNWRMKEAMRSEFTRRLAMGCLFLSKKECLDLPDELPPVYRMIELPKDAMKYYKQMEREQILLLEDRSILAQTKLTALMKLRQITSGFVIDTDNDSEVSHLHTAKVDELRAVVEELGDNPAIIWINFKREVADIAGLLDAMGRTYVTAFSGTRSVDDSIQSFKKNEAQFIIAHPKTLKYGVTFTGDSMTRNCTYAIYYSMSYSFEDFYQSRDRIYRKGQNQGCTYIFLVAEDTVDEDIYAVIERKGTSAMVVENMIRRCQKK